MDRVLIVDDNRRILAKMSSMLNKYANGLDVVTAVNGNEAIQLLENTHVDLVITDLVMPEGDGLTLLAHISEQYPHILCAAMTGFATDNIISMLPDNLLQIIRKPFKIYDLIEMIKLNLKKKPPAGTVYGISISSFLQLIEIEEKSCALVVLLENHKTGTFLFSGGVLYDAIFGNMTGEDAAIEILQHNEKAAFTFKSLPKQNISRRITKNMMELLIEASWRTDMNAFNALAPSTAQTSATNRIMN